MTIIFNGNDFKYRIESVMKMFFPCTKFQLLYEVDTKMIAEYIHKKENNCLFTRMKKGRENTYLLCIFSYNGKLYYSHKVIKNNSEKFDKEAERLICVALYECVKNATDIDVKWGVVTGVRPVKQMNYMSDQGKSMEQIESIFANDFLVNQQKIDLCKKTRENQSAIIKKSKNNSYSMYISIPFCPTRCSYCSFVSSAINTPKTQKLIKDYFEKLLEEIKYTADIVNKYNIILETIYIGGGTPTSLDALSLKRLCDFIESSFNMDTVCEFTIEAGRADTITKEKLQVIRDSKATRISINPQTFNDDVLKEIGRNHSSQDVRNCYNMALELGINNINMDFIAGLPTDTLESFKKTIDEAIEISPTNITVHTLSIKRSSDLYSDDGLDESLKGVQTAKMVEYAYNKLVANGYSPYYLYRQKNTLQNMENVGYSKKGYEGYYNIYIMEEIHSIVAVGASGITKLLSDKCTQMKRIPNFKYPFEYLKDFDTILKRKDETEKFFENNFSKNE